MPVKQVKLNLKPEIYKPLSQEAKRLRMPIAALVRVILADAILPDQDDVEATSLDNILELPTEMITEVFEEQENQGMDSSGSQIGTGITGESTGVSNELLMDVARSLADSANALAETTHVLAGSVRELTQLSKAAVSQPVVNQPVVSHPIVNQPALNPAARQPRVDKDGELVLKLSDLLAEQGMQSSAIVGTTAGTTADNTIGAVEGVLPGTAMGLTQDVIVEDLNTLAQQTQQAQPTQPAQKLRKITINL